MLPKPVLQFIRRPGSVGISQAFLTLGFPLLSTHPFIPCPSQGLPCSRSSAEGASWQRHSRDIKFAHRDVCSHHTLLSSTVGSGCDSPPSSTAADLRRGTWYFCKRNLKESC